MKKVILTVILILGTASVSWSDEYLLLMSKDDNVCNNLLYEFNEDLKVVGKINIKRHEDLAPIIWEKKYATSGGVERSPILVSRFDINNDGMEEIVVKWEGLSLHSHLTDKLRIYSMSDSNLFMNDFNAAKAIDKIIFEFPKESDSQQYCLKELPRSRIAPSSSNGRKFDIYYNCIGPFFEINPFRFGSVSYVSVIGTYGYHREWHLILRYTKDNAPKDICYLFRVYYSNRNNRKGVGQ